MSEFITEWAWDERRNAPQMMQHDEIVSCRDCDQLKPCPFCGGEAEFNIIDNICNIVCKECHIGTRYERVDDYEKTAEAWNRRAQ